MLITVQFQEYGIEPLKSQHQPAFEEVLSVTPADQLPEGQAAYCASAPKAQAASFKDPARLAKEQSVEGLLGG